MSTERHPITRRQLLKILAAAPILTGPLITARPDRPAPDRAHHSRPTPPAAPRGAPSYQALVGVL